MFLIENSHFSINDYDKYLKNLSPLKEQASYLDTASRIIATTDKQIFEELANNEVGKHCEVLFIDDLEQISETLGGYDEVIWIGTDFMLEEGLPNVITVSETQRNNFVQILPEKILKFFARNKKTLESISKLSKLLKTLPLIELPVFIPILFFSYAIGVLLKIFE